MKTFKAQSFVLLTISLLIFTSCKKLIIDKEPAGAAGKMVGQYTMSEIIANGQTIKLPYKQGTDELNGTIVIKKTTDVEIEVNYTFNTVLKGVKETDTVSEIYFVKQGSKDLELFEDEKFAKQIGSLVDNKTLFLVSGETDRITAIKN
jgi:hypothetical protein